MQNSFNQSNNNIKDSIYGLSAGEILAKRERELVAVCRDFLHEQPLFPLNYIKQSEVEEGYASKRVEDTNAVSEAKRRYYGMGKLKQVISILKFGRLKDLGEKETLTDDELTSVKGMFK